MEKKWIAIGLGAVLLSTPVVMKLARGKPLKEVEVERVSTHLLTPTILASGSLTYESQVTLTPEVAGRVKEILVEEGEVVEQDQLLMRLDPAQGLAEVSQIEAQIRQSELTIQRRTVDRDAQVITWKRNQVLKDQGIIQSSTYDGIVAQKDMAEVDLRTSREILKQMEAQLKQARERLAKTEIRSPLMGKVTAIFIKQGETAIPSAISIAGSQLMQVADTSSVFAEINVDETDVTRVKVGSQAKIVPAAFSDAVLTGAVERVAIWPRQASGGQNKSYPVKIKLDANHDFAFHPGMSCRAEILTSLSSDKPTIAVPVQSVRYEDPDNKIDKPKTSVFVFVADHVSKRDVEVGTADDTYIEISRGLQANEQIVVGSPKTLHYLRDGDGVVKASSSVSPSVVASATHAN